MAMSATEIISSEAVRIGQHLCDVAFWDDENRICNWMGRWNKDGAPATLCSKAIGSDVYSGSAGIAIVLTDLFVKTGNDNFKRVAEGAVRRSISIAQSELEHPTGTSPISFYCGHLGVVFSAVHLMSKIPSLDFSSDLSALISNIESSFELSHALDVIGGNAGAIPALLQLSNRLQMPLLRALAIKCGRELCELAQWRDQLCVWEPSLATGLATDRPLGGYAHGASGIARGLLELYLETGSAQFRDTARGAFTYEMTLYSQRHKNWKDVRYSYSGLGKDDGSHYPTAWCHGAAGIVLARKRSKVLDVELRFEHDEVAEIAIQTTKQAIERILALPSYDISLCHGIAGLSEVLLCASIIDSDPSLEALSRSVAGQIIESCRRSGNWSSGIPGAGPHPSLMLGNAGLAHHLLRLLDHHDIQSLLLVPT
jgi:lantibiotic biosynthesis protein